MLRWDGNLTGTVSKGFYWRGEGALSCNCFSRISDKSSKIGNGAKVINIVGCEPGFFRFGITAADMIVDGTEGGVDDGGDER